MNVKELTVDVIIPTYKPDEKYEKLVECLLKQTIKPQHIFVVNTIPAKGDNPNVSKPFGEVNDFSVIEIEQKEFNHGGTRNMAVEQTSGDLVLLMTQDAVPKDRHLIENMVKAFADDAVSVAYARQLATKEVGIIENYTRQFNYPAESKVKSLADVEELGIKTYFCSDVCAMYRRDIYQKLGGFETDTLFGEDMILAARMIKSGYKVAYVAEAMVYHAHKYTGKQQFQRNFDMGVAQSQHSEIYEGVKSESEGMKMVKKTAGYLLRQGKPWKLIELVWQSGWKFLGYKFGKKYKSLPMWLVRSCSSQKAYWQMERK